MNALAYCKSLLNRTGGRCARGGQGITGSTSQTPAAALRQAQLAMWQQEPDPRLWAAFTLQGDWLR